MMYIIMVRDWHVYNVGRKNEEFDKMEDHC